MRRNYIPLKDSKKLRQCNYCIRIKGRSKAFVSEFALTYHITHEHKDDIGIVEPARVYHHDTIEREID